MNWDETHKRTTTTEAPITNHMQHWRGLHDLSKTVIERVTHHPENYPGTPPGQSRHGVPHRSAIPDEAKSPTCLTRDSSLQRFCPFENNSRCLSQCGSDTRGPATDQSTGKTSNSERQGDISTRVLHGSCLRWSTRPTTVQKGCYSISVRRTPIAPVTDEVCNTGGGSAGAGGGGTSSTGMGTSRMTTFPRTLRELLEEEKPSVIFFHVVIPTSVCSCVHRNCVFW